MGLAEKNGLFWHFDQDNVTGDVKRVLIGGGVFGTSPVCGRTPAGVNKKKITLYKVFCFFLLLFNISWRVMNCNNYY